MSEQLFSLRSFTHAVSGSVAGQVAITVFYPLNLIRTKRQLQDRESKRNVFQGVAEFAKTEGVLALYVGLWANLVCIGSSNFVYFYIYNGLRAAVLTRKRHRGRVERISAKANLVIASVAGSLNVLITNPLWVASMRIMAKGMRKAHEEDGVLESLQRIASTEGVRALWNGVLPSLMLVSNPVVQFVTYEYLKKLWQRICRRSALRGFEFFLIGALAKVAATVATYPIQLAQSRLRNTKHIDCSSEEYSGVVDCLVKTARKDGVRGLFRGMEAKLWQTVLGAAFHFAVYEKLIQLIQRMLVLKALQ
eukprot:TRINITY_DN13570_c0_g1_i1.p1 TRINITY_DN13570_c0_g1~~TRINITY_DN13570_c0_g1_i1.p1  ORF type:complete len:306 (+),score=45.62 TRINITY_DN13570_c0_g1_i1:74-991(+)